MFMLGGTNAALSLYKTLEKDLDEARLVNHAAFARVMVVLCKIILSYNTS